MLKLRFSPLASKDLNEINQYIIEDTCDERVANKTLNNILSKALLLENLPLMGNSLKAKIDMATDYRYLVAGSYLLFYKVEKEFISIYRVIHSRRDFVKVLFENDRQGSL